MPRLDRNHCWPYGHLKNRDTGMVPPPVSLFFLLQPGLTLDTCPDIRFIPEIAAG